MTLDLSDIASVLFASAVGWFVWTLTTFSQGRAQKALGISRLEAERRDRIRTASRTYDRFEPLVAELVSINELLFDRRMRDELDHSLKLATSPIPWAPAEFISCRQLEGVVAGSVIVMILLLRFSPMIALAIGSGVVVVYVFQAIQAVKQAAADRVSAIKRRLPFAIDLIALMLQAGASFSEGLKTAGRENASHALGDELTLVIKQIEMGRPRRLALEGFQNRMADQDVDDLVTAINKGEELGTPLSIIMQTQADQMRLKRSQWGERAAAEAQVRMTFPAMVVMVACMLLILAPFLLPLAKMY